MSKLTETKQAYDRVQGLLRKQLLTQGSDARQIRAAQEAVDTAFYLLGWGQFEYLTRREAERRVDEQAKAKTIHGAAWRYVKQNIKSFSLRKKLEVIFHADQATLASLEEDYERRNETAHDYKKLPKEARDISAWLKELEQLVDRY
ncbi:MULTISPECIES: hypothetical protein [unclassified Methylobacterium]|uniref:hypothetical protein n=1 Tax=unclassified Methylobacterium TaxID=2615210 RepID=UPI001FBB1907|nr:MULTISPECIES: hypothetical protein [unclassified Methylobacterium]MCJ2093980.1 hypothetical protein [Methylobacterium sp. J-072]MCJ2138577.1 hypothetical protein [Methylobacterium sp. E-066]